MTPRSATHGFYLEEVAKAFRRRFRRITGRRSSIAKLQHILPVVAAMGAAVSVVDFDRDGWPDLYVINSGEGSKNHLYHNQHDGTFKDVAEERGPR